MTTPSSLQDLLSMIDAELQATEAFNFRSVPARTIPQLAQIGDWTETTEEIRTRLRALEQSIRELGTSRPPVESARTKAMAALERLRVALDDAQPSARAKILNLPW